VAQPRDSQRAKRVRRSRAQRERRRTGAFRFPYSNVKQLLASSLRAKRSNPDFLRGYSLDCFRLRSSSFGGHVVADAPRNDGRDVGPHSRGAIRPSFASFASLWMKRAQGMPGAGRTHGQPATKKAGGSHHRYAATAGIPCAMV